MATAKGIIIVEGTPLPFSITCRATPGDGQIYLKGRVASTFPETLSRVFDAIRNIEDYLDLSLSSFGADYHIRLENEQDIPLAGDSLGLPLAMSIMSALAKKQLPADCFYTGGVAATGEVLPILDIAVKRRAAAGFGGKKLFLPLSQLDFLSSFIAQCPVKTISDAFSITYWGYNS